MMPILVLLLLLPHALSSFLLITVSKIRTFSTTSNPRTKQRTPSNPVSTEASPPFSVRSHTQTVTVHMVLPFPRLSFPLQLYPAWLWQHPQTKAVPFMMCNHLHTPFRFLPWLLSSQADASVLKHSRDHLLCWIFQSYPSSNRWYQFRTQSWAALPGQFCLHLWNSIYFFIWLPPFFPPTQSVYSNSPCIS